MTIRSDWRIEVKSTGTRFFAFCGEIREEGQGFHFLNHEGEHFMEIKDRDAVTVQEVGPCRHSTP